MLSKKEIRNEARKFRFRKAGFDSLEAIQDRFGRNMDESWEYGEISKWKKSYLKMKKKN